MENLEGIFIKNLEDAEPLQDDHFLMIEQPGASGAREQRRKAYGGFRDGLQGFPFSPELKGEKIEIVAGTLRQNGTTRTQWDWIKDSLHEPIGVDDSSPAVASGTIITIPYLKTYSKVISFIVAPDERLANALNLSIGSSVGTSYSQIKASAELTLAAHIKYNGTTWEKTYGAGQGGVSDHNVEITGLTLAGANLTISHTWLPGANISVVGHTDNGAVIPYRPVIRSIGNTSVVVNFINSAGSFVSPADTSMSFLITKNFAGGIALDGTDNGNVLDLDLGNIWFYGIFQV